jgi:nucleoside-diphosphate-sugar epimerase
LINKIYNLTRGRAHSLLDTAHTVVDIVGKGKIEVIAKDDNFPSRGALDISAAQKDFGYNPKVDVEEGFKLYHEWLQI